MPPRFIVPPFSASVPALVSKLPDVRVSVPALLVIEPWLVQALVGDKVSVPLPLFTIELVVPVEKLLGLMVKS